MSITTILELPNHAVLDVRPGDQVAATAVEGWLGEYATTRDPRLRERILLAYLGPGWPADRPHRRHVKSTHT